MTGGTRLVGGRTAEYHEWRVPCHERTGTYKYGIGAATGVVYTERTWYLPREKVLILDEWNTPGLASVLAKATWK